ncbi:methylenetetrahydrofolate reductase [Caenispirillum salinarum]|uniref:hypothetical protein n=1 Tax=Caenispirillum salinarum TaxID=859058 RepID=UPI0002FA91AD|nr:hypothetical protein [Caenispirillum salinarum]
MSPSPSPSPASSGEEDPEPGLAEAAAVRALSRSFSTEVTPRAARALSRFDALLPHGTAVYVPHLPGLDYEAVVPPLCARLKAEGMVPVPHLAVRAVPSREALDRWLAALVDRGGVDRLLLLAGGTETPAGPFASTLPVLDDGILLRHGLTTLGVAGHPEGHPQASAEELARALKAKQDYAAETGSTLWITTQFTFSATPVVGWLRAIRAAGITLPVRVGLPGPASPRTLLRYALSCGIGASLTALRRRPGAAAGLLGTWTPEAMIRDIAAAAVAEPQSAPQGLHAFPFGGVETTAHWFRALSGQRAEEEAQSFSRAQRGRETRIGS